MVRYFKTHDNALDFIGSMRGKECSLTLGFSEYLNEWVVWYSLGRSV